MAKLLRLFDFFEQDLPESVLTEFAPEDGPEFSLAMQLGSNLELPLLRVLTDG